MKTFHATLTGLTLILALLAGQWVYAFGGGRGAAAPANPAPPAPANAPGPGATRGSTPSVVPDVPEPNGAILETDSNLDSSLLELHKDIQGKFYEGAALRIQQIIDAPSHLLALDGKVLAESKQIYNWPGAGINYSWVYRPMREEAERIVAAMPREGLEVYRRSADVQARTLLSRATETGDVQALNQLVRRYFMSSLGDDAALLLAGMMIDRYEFTGARALLIKIRDIHPDPSVSRSLVLARLALASARSGDSSGAGKAMSELETLGDSRVGPQMITALRREITAATAGQVNLDRVANEWPVHLGSPARDGVMPIMADISHGPGSALTVLWSAIVGDFAVPSDLVSRSDVILVDPNSGQPIPSKKPDVIRRWKASGWTPTAQLLIHGGHLFFRNHDFLIRLNADTGGSRAQSFYRDVPLVAIANQNVLRVPYNSSSLKNQPSTVEEVAFFGDRIRRSLSLWNGLVFYLPGLSSADHFNATNPIVQRIGNPASGPTNKMTALDAATMHLRWDPAVSPNQSPPRKPGDKEDDGTGGFTRLQRFLAPPVPVGDRIVAPLADGESIYLVALDPGHIAGLPADRTSLTSSRMLWKTFLCSEPVIRNDPWSPVAVSVADGNVYVGTGRGIVFCVDGIDGSVRWATRYKRSEGENTSQRNSAFNNRIPRGAGWVEDTVIVTKDLLTVLPSDASDKGILFIDRHTGQLRALGNGTPACRYAIGVSQQMVTPTGREPELHDILYLGGSDGSSSTIVAYDLATQGRFKSPMVSNVSMTGRPALTPNAIYLPIASGSETYIYAVDPATLTLLTTFSVMLPDEEPLGNLYSDGQRLYALGMERIHALIDPNQLLTALSRRIERGDPQARLQRGYLRLRMNPDHAEPATSDLQAAVEDFRIALRDLPDSDSGLNEARRTLVDCLLILTGRSEPAQGMKYLEDAQAAARSESETVRVQLARGRLLTRLNDIPQAATIFSEMAAQSRSALLSMGNLEPGTDTLASNLGLLEINALLQKNGSVVTQVLADKSAQFHRAALAVPLPDETRPALAAIIRAFPGTPAALEVLCTLGDEQFDGRDGPFKSYAESAEIILRDKLDSPDPVVAAAAMTGLARLYDSRGWKSQAASLWQRLQQRYANVSLPMKGATFRVGDLAAAALADIPLAALALDPSRGKLPEPSAESNTYRLLWQARSPGSIPVLPGTGPASSYLSERVLVFQPGNQDRALIMRRAQSSGSDEAPWAVTNGQLPGSLFAPRNNAGINDQQKFYRAALLPDGELVRSDHVLLFRNDNSVLAVSLWTGKLLWKYQVMDGRIPEGRAVSDPRVSVLNDEMMRLDMVRNPQSTATPVPGNVMSAGSGVVAVLTLVNGRAVIKVLDAAEQASPAGEEISPPVVRWSRAFEGEVIDLAVAAGFVNVVVNNGTEMSVLVCDRYTGRMVSRVELKRRNGRTPLAWSSQGVLFYAMPQGPERGRVVYVELATGRTLWEEPAEIPSRIGVFNSTHAWIINQNNTRLTALKLAQQSNNQPQLAWEFPASSAGNTSQRVFGVGLSPDESEVVVTGTSSSNRVYMAGLNLLSGSRINASGQIEFGPRGNFEWSIENMMEVATSLAACGDVMPVLVGDGSAAAAVRAGGRGRAQPVSYGWELAFFRKSARGDAQRDVTIRIDARDIRLLAPPMVRGGAIILTTPDGVMAFGR